MIAPNADVSTEVASWWRMVELCLPCHEVCGAATFAPTGAGTLEDEWVKWAQESFVTVLRPALFDLQTAADEQSLPGLLGREAALNGALSASFRSRSLACGREALLGQTPPRGAKLLERLRDTAASEDNCGHLATIFALRGRIFHLPFLQVIGAYLLAEAVLGAESTGITLPAERVAAMLNATCVPASTAEQGAHLVAV